MKYLKVPTAESSVLHADESPRHSSSSVKRAVRWLNSYVQITSPAYQHERAERKLSLTIFLIFFVCFIFSMVFVFSGGDVCFSHAQGLERLRIERDHLREEIVALKAQLAGPSEVTSEEPQLADHVIP